MDLLSDWWKQTEPKQKMAQIIVFFMVFGFSTMITGASHGIPMGLGIIYILYDCIQKRSLSGFAMPGKLWLGIVVFLSSVVLSSVLLGDKPSIHTAFQYVYWFLPLLIMFYLGRQADVKYAAVGGAILSLLVSSLDMVHVNYLLLQGQKVALPVPGRLGAFFRSPNVHATLLSGVLPLVFCAFCDKKIRFPKWLVALQVAVIVLGLWSLWKTGSRGGMFGFCTGGIFVFLAVYFRERIWRVVFALVLTGAILISGYVVFGVTPVSHGYDDTTRLRMLSFSYDMWKDHKWLGVGLENWRKEYLGHYFKEDVVRKAAMRYYMAQLARTNETFSAEKAAEVQQAALNEESRHEMPHNAIAWFFATTGSIGGIGYVFFVLFYFYALLKKLREQPGNWMLPAGLWIFLAMTLHGFLDIGVVDKGVARLTYLMLGLALSYACVENTAERF